MVQFYKPETFYPCSSVYAAHRSWELAGISLIGLFQLGCLGINRVEPSFAASRSAFYATRTFHSSARCLCTLPYHAAGALALLLCTAAGFGGVLWRLSTLLFQPNEERWSCADTRDANWWLGHRRWILRSLRAVHWLSPTGGCPKCSLVALWTGQGGSKPHAQFIIHSPSPFVSSFLCTTYIP